MTDNNTNNTNEQTSTQHGPYSAQTSVDPDIGSQVISLLYEDASNPAKSITVSIAPDLGSNMFRFRVGTFDIIHYERQLLKERNFTGNFVLWPLPNRVREKQYTYEGKHYSLAKIQRPGGDPSLIHGLVFDQPWHYEQPVVKSNSVSVTTSIAITPDSPHYQAYPFKSTLALTYTLTSSGVTVTYHVQNQDSRTLPFGFALHPYFALPAGPEQTSVSIPAHVVMEADKALLPTGRLLPLDGEMYAMFDLRTPVPISHLKLDHVYTELQHEKSMLIQHHKQGINVHLASSYDFTHAVIYTLGGTSSFCLENQTCSTDAINLHHRGMNEIAHLQEVRPQETRTGFITYTVEVE